MLRLRYSKLRVPSRMFKVVAMSAIAAAVSSGVPLRAASPAATLASAKLAIREANQDWAGAMKTRDAKRVAAPYADDALFIAPDGEITRGRAAIERMLADRFASGSNLVSATIQSDAIRLAGSSVVELGHGEIVQRAPSGRRASTSHYITIWRRSAQGRWQIEKNILL